MPRKRSRHVLVDAKNINVKKILNQHQKRKSIKKKISKKLPIAVSLVGIFCLVLFFNSYFNYVAGTAHNEEGQTLGTSFFLSGPDPYYNMRLCQQTLETGEYPFVTYGDPLLNYPVGHATSARPPLFNMITVGLTKVLDNFMPTMDALGWLMLFLPAIYGALLVFPIYGISKELFNKQIGLISAMLVAIIPIHIGAGHGSAFSLYDHDSFVLLLFVTTFYFFIKSLKTEDKRGLFYAGLAGITAGAIQLTWAAGQVILIIIFIYAIVQFIFDVLQNKLDIGRISRVTIVLGLSYLISVPFFMAKNVPFHYAFYLSLFSLCLLFLYILIKKSNLPWLISMPSLGIGFCGGLGLLYLVNKGILAIPGAIYAMSEIIFGEGVYGSKVALTIGEAHVYNLSRTVMSFGPVLYWLGLGGFILYVVKTYKEKFRPECLFFIIIFVVNFWFTTTAGRFVNDLIPSMVVFSAFLLYVIIKKLDIASMIKSIKSVTGIKKAKPLFKVRSIACFSLVFALITPNVFMTLDASVPPEKKVDMFGEDFRGAYGNSLGQQIYWADAMHWLSEQDTEIERPQDRPAIITWWDYGFYISSMGEHPTVADNYQSGIPCAGNFLTAKSEEEAVAVLIVRLCEGAKERFYEENGYYALPDNIKQLFKDYLPYTTNASLNETDMIVSIRVNQSYRNELLEQFPGIYISMIIENPVRYALTYNELIVPEYGNTILRKSAENAMYHDATKILVDNLDDEYLTRLYMKMREVTGYNIIYFGIDQRDREIFAVFPFLSDKSTHGYVTEEDDYFISFYLDELTGNRYFIDDLQNMTREEYDSLQLSQKTEYKDGFFNNMYFRTYYGYTNTNTIPDERIPTYALKHWFIDFISPYVTIARYYEGAKVTGKVLIDGVPYLGTTICVLDEYGIAHDIQQLDYNGQYNVIAPAGKVSIGVYIGNNALETRTFDMNITEAEATRQVESNRNMSFDISLANVDVTIKGLNNTMTLELTSLTYPDMHQNVSIVDGTYQFSDLIPDAYIVSIYNETTQVYQQTHFLKPSNNQINLTVGL